MGTATLRRAAAIALGLALVVAGCAPRLAPAPTARLVPGRGEGAAATEAGVTVEARVGAWQARPVDLELLVTPVLVTVDNQSGRPLRVRYEHFELVAGGRTYVARSPFAVRGWVSEPLAALPRPWLGFRVVGVHGGRAILLADPFLDPFWWDPFPGWRYGRVGLPTGDMVALALPERTVEPGARVTGFVYFDRLTRDGADVEFVMRLVDARSGEEFGRVVIPFVLR